MILLPHYLNELKQHVLYKTGIQAITPGHCKVISLAINKAVNKNVSETTIKRLYGFADSSHNPSQYTITALCEYIGQDSWEKLCAAIEEKNVRTTSLSWDHIRKRAQELTNYTLQTTKNKTGIPYELTTDRKFAEVDFDYFLKSKETFTCLVSQTGFGKSVMLSRIADKFFSGNEAPYRDSVVWFINANSLVNTHSFELESWLNELLGFSSDKKLIQNIKTFTTEKSCKAILILDGLDESSFKKDKLVHLCDKIADLLCGVSHDTHLKIILSMRPLTWTSLYERIRNSAYLRSHWHAGSHFKSEEFQNMPPLSDKEIDQILKNTDPGFNKGLHINARLRAQLRFPYYIQLYYQMFESEKKIEYQKDHTVYELTASFINQKIYLSRFSTEKIFLLKKIIQMTKNSKEGNSILKMKLLNDISAFPTAYEDLLQQGVLLEEKLPNHLISEERIRFVHPGLFEYFLHLEILEIFGKKVDSRFLAHIINEYNNSQWLQLLQLTVRYVIINKQLEPLTEILQLSLPSSEKNQLILFIADTLRHKSRHINGFFKDYDYRKLQKAFITELLHFDLTDPFYNDALLSLANLNIQKDDNLIYLIFNAYGSVMMLDKTRLLNCIARMRMLETDTSKWPFDPIECLELIYSRINSIPSDGKLTEQIRLFIKNPQRFKKNNASITDEEKISYLLILLLNSFEGSKKATTAIINSILILYPDVFEDHSSGFATYLLHIHGLGLLRIEDYAGAEKIIKIIKKNNLSERTNYSTVLHLTIMAELEITKGNYSEAIEYLNDCLAICRGNGISFNQIRPFYSLINIHNLMGEKEKMEQSVNDLQLLLEEQDISINIFLDGGLNYKKFIGIEI